MTRSISDLPGPPRLPLIGNAHQLLRLDRNPVTLEKWSRRYGPLVRFDVGRRRGVLIGDPKSINAILRERPRDFRRASQIESVFEECRSAGVFSQEGEDWRRARRLVVTALNSNHLQRYFDVVRTACERLRLRLDGEGTGGRPFDPIPSLTSFSLDIISALAFGVDLNTLGRSDDELQRHLRTYLHLVNRRLLTPIPYWRWFRLPSDRAGERSLDALHQAVARFIEAAREQLRTDPRLREAPENFLQSMVAAQETEDRFSDEEIVGNTLTLLIAGEDTTAHTMAWTTWLLAQRPDSQADWAEEAIEVLGEREFVDDYEMVGRLAYGEAALRESMRLRPVVPLTAFEPLADVTIAGVQIPAGTPLVTMLRHAGLHESGIVRATEFDPERWLEKEGSAPDQRSFLAFGSGPRFCPGRNLAFLEAKAGMATIARNFEIELDEHAAPVREKANFTTVPENLRIRLRPRGGR